MSLCLCTIYICDMLYLPAANYLNLFFPQYVLPELVTKRNLKISNTPMQKQSSIANTKMFTDRPQSPTFTPVPVAGPRPSTKKPKPAPRKVKRSGQSNSSLLSSSVTSGSSVIICQCICTFK